MPIPEPPPTYGLWPEVRAVTGWPVTDEDRMRELAAAWRSGGASFTRAAGHDFSALADAWPDSAGQAMQTNVSTMLQRAAMVGAGMDRMAGRADGFAAEVTGVKQGINDLMAKNIDLYGREIATLPAAAQPAAHAGFVQQLAGLVNEMMTAAATRIAAAGPIEGIDQIQGISLAQSAAQAGAAAGAQAGTVIPPELAPGTDPAVVRQTWENLDPPDRAAILANDPDRIRNLDGIPSDVRNAANEAVLGRELAALHASEEDLIARNKLTAEDGADAAIVAELHQVRNKIEGLEEIDALVQADNDLLLLGLDTSDDGKAIIASGNPDTATNVITHIPGSFHDLSTVTDDEALGRAISLREPAGGGPPDATTASILWLGYDAPDEGTDEVQSDRQAAEGKAALQQFQLGLRALNDDARLTVEAHSYGTTVLGHAAREQLAADHVILVASTDPGVQSAADYHLDRVDPADIGRHVHATQAINDHVASALTDRYGNNPTLPPIGTRPGFGADVFTTDYTPSPVAAHSASYDKGNAALETIRDITRGTGRYNY